MNTQTQFDALPPVPTSILIGGETLEVTPLKVGELPAFARAVRPIASKLSPSPDWLRLLSEDGESVILALAIACRRPPDWVSALALDEAILLAEAVFGANADFFIRRVVPEVTRVSNRIGTLLGGATPSSVSSTPDTAIPTS
jgi:hypothetical protein